MSRKLTAIEIAEGALLADVAVIFHLLYWFLPIPLVSDSFRLFIPTVFAVLVLRRSFYVGLMGLSVTLFIIALLAGLYSVIPMIWASGAGLYLGLVMKRRVGHFFILLIGVTATTLGGVFSIIVLMLLGGLPISNLPRDIHRGFVALTSLIDISSTLVGLNDWWKHNLYPLLSNLEQLVLANWLLFLLLVVWLVLWPIVIFIYYLTNLFVRLLGYEVRPFPDGWLNRRINRNVRRIVKRALKRGLFPGRKPRSS